MNINFPAAGDRIHRHFVVFPVFLCLLMLPFMLAGVEGRHSASVQGADIQASSSGNQSFAEPDGTYGFLFAGAHGQTGTGGALLLTQGAVLAAGEGITRIATGRVQLTGFHGAMHVTADTQALTVAALSTPVLFHAGSFVSVVPQGMQQRFDLSALPSALSPDATVSALHSALPLPQEFTAEQLGRLQSNAAPTDIFASSPLPVALGFLQLPLPHARMEDAFAFAQASRIGQALRAGDDSVLRDALSDTGMLATLSRFADGRAMILRLLAAGVSRPAVVRNLLPFVQDPDLRVLAFFQQDLRPAAWLHVDDSRMSAMRPFVLLAFPMTDLLSDGAPAAAVARWETAAATVAQAAPDQIFFSSLLRILADARKVAEQNGYPERLQRYAQAVKNIAQDVSLLSDDEKSAVASWQPYLSLGNAVRTDPVPAASSDAIPVATPPSSAASSAATMAPADAQSGEASIHDFLSQHGALFTTKTVIRAISSAAVSVQSIVFASGDGDHSFDFIIDPASKQMSAIVRDGADLPLSLGFDVFTAWVRH